MCLILISAVSCCAIHPNMRNALPTLTHELLQVPPVEMERYQLYMCKISNKYYSYLLSNITDNLLISNLLVFLLLSGAGEVNALKIQRHLQLKVGS